MVLSQMQESGVMVEISSPVGNVVAEQRAAAEARLLEALGYDA